MQCLDLTLSFRSENIWLHSFFDFVAYNYFLLFLIFPFLIFDIHFNLVLNIFSFFYQCFVVRPIGLQFIFRRGNYYQFLTLRNKNVNVRRLWFA